MARAELTARYRDYISVFCAPPRILRSRNSTASLANPSFPRAFISLLPFLFPNFSTSFPFDAIFHSTCSTLRGSTTLFREVYRVFFSATSSKLFVYFCSSTKFSCVPLNSRSFYSRVNHCNALLAMIRRQSDITDHVLQFREKDCFLCKYLGSSKFQSDRISFVEQGLILKYNLPAESCAKGVWEKVSPC